MFSSAVNTVNGIFTIHSSGTYSVNKGMNVNSREHYVPEDSNGPGFNVAPGAVKVPTATSKKGKFP
jgi:hypothetical protein